MRQEKTLEYKIDHAVERFVRENFERVAEGEKEGLVIQVKAKYYGWRYWNKYVLNVVIHRANATYEMERWLRSFHSYSNAEKQFQSLVSKYSLSVK